MFGVSELYTLSPCPAATIAPVIKPTPTPKDAPKRNPIQTFGPHLLVPLSRS
jgi:hypothetical protein